MVYQDGRFEHVAMISGSWQQDSHVLVRVHSKCLTSEVFGSLRCDCRHQLDAAMERVASVGGVVVYLDQEGRGIGLGNKIRAYALQDNGADTVEANRQLGFADDDRSYDIAADILRDLGITSVRLMTNNPHKVEGLLRAGLSHVVRESHWVASHEKSSDYLAVKQKKLGHIANEVVTKNETSK